MATLKDHQQAMVDLLASGSGIPASASRLAHAMHDVLSYMAQGDAVSLLHTEKRSESTTSGLNDKALAADVEACRPKATPAERRVKELENTCKQLRYNLRVERIKVQQLEAAYEEAMRPKLPSLPEQAGVRKDDAQVCKHVWGQAIDSDFRKCVICGATEDIYQ